METNDMCDNCPSARGSVICLMWLESSSWSSSSSVASVVVACACSSCDSCALWHYVTRLCHSTMTLTGSLKVWQ